MERIHGETETHSGDGEVDSRMHVRAGARGKENDPGSGGRTDDDPFGRIGERAAETASRLRDVVGSGISRAGTALDHRTGIVTTIRQRPLTALGVALSTGFLLAAATERRERHWLVERSRLRLRTAIISGVTAALAHELRSLLGGEEGIGHLVRSFFQEGGDDEEIDFEAEDYDLDR